MQSSNQSCEGTGSMTTFKRTCGLLAAVAALMLMGGVVEALARTGAVGLIATCVLVLSAVVVLLHIEVGQP